MTLAYVEGLEAQSKGFVEQMLRGYTLIKKCVLKDSVVLLGYPLIRMPTPREANLLKETGLQKVRNCKFHNRAIINGNRIHTRTCKTLFKRINCAVVLLSGSIGIVRSFVDVGYECMTAFAFINPVVTCNSSIVTDKQTGATATGIVRKVTVSNDIQLIKCSDILTTCVYLCNIPDVVDHFYCIQPNKWEVD